VRFLIDTNILLHAVNSASPDHLAARRFLQQHLQSRTPWYITWPILYEFLRVSTHFRVFPKPLKAKQALDFITGLSSHEEMAILTGTNRHWDVLANVIAGVNHPAGNLFHDIHTATLMLEHGVSDIVTADSDFRQFGFLKVINPLLG